MAGVIWAGLTGVVPSEIGARQVNRPPGSGEAEAPEGDAPPKRMSIARVDGGAIRVDGRLDDAVWATATFRSDFMQRGTDRGFKPRVETEVAFLYDDEALYVGAWMEDDPGGSVGPLLGARDDPGNAERILVSLDTYRNRTTAYTFGVTQGGVRLDFVQSRDRAGSVDNSFDPVWDARVAADSTGWTAEMRIPFSQLRFSPGEEQVWGLNVRRWNPATYLDTYWVVVPYQEAGWASRFGELRGLDGISGGAGAEIVPYVVQDATFLDPYYGGDGAADLETRVGGDLKLGLGSNLTFDGTVNPDFGQVEADPARVNLTAFETFFPERRPFFLEGRELFVTQGPSWFYSRRIGATPADVVKQDLLAQVDPTTILAGGRLTGRTPGGLSVGALSAVTDRAHLSSGPGASREVAPRTGFGVLRLKQELGGAGSSIGVIGTAVDRFFSDGSRMSDLLPGRALAGGGDFVVRFGSARYEVSGFAGGSRITGTPAAIERRQRSSARYLQRPDADHVALDPGRTSLMGWTAGLRAGRVGGVGLRWTAELEAASPGFDLVDAGYQPHVDVLNARGRVSYEIRDGKGALRHRTFGVAFDGGWNFGGTRTATVPSVFWSAAWSNRWRSYLEVGMNAPALSDDLTRGGPLMATPRSWWTRMQLFPRQTGRSWWEIEAYGLTDGFGGWTTSLNGGFTVRAGSRLSLSVYTGGLLGDDSRLYLQRSPGGPDATFGTRYVFSSLKRRELFAQLRTELAFAPDAVLTLYAEPFVSSGSTHGFGELTAARAGSLRSYGTDGTSITRLEDGAREVEDGEDTFRIENHDYWVRTFRGTAVLRWEWRAGSFLSLIWRKDQWVWEPNDRPTGPGNLLRSLDDPGMDILLAKMSVLLGSR